LEKKYSDLQSQVDKQSVKLLSRMQAKEDKLKRKLQGIDSSKAQKLFTTDVTQRYGDLQSKLTSLTANTTRFPLKDYVPGLDSVQTTLSFLLSNPNLPSDKLQQLQSLSTKLQGLEGQLQAANDIQQFVRDREALLKAQLMNTGLVKELTGINQEVYYYQARLSEYKELLNDKDKLKDKLISTVRTLPAFQKFWQRNSYLAQLFPMPYTGAPQTSSGLQTRATVQNLLVQRLGSGMTTVSNTMANPQQYVQPGVDQAQAQMSQLKNKLSQLSEGGNSDMTTPDFKPNDQKTKTFLQRVEYGLNIQSQPGTNFLPATSDLALMLGYKLSSTKEFGIGESYKMGWGSGWNDIKLSSQGVGFRSFMDVKAKGSIWLTGGFEYNYLTAFTNLRDLQNNIDVWQKSALMGLSKKYKIGKKKEGNVQVLYDFLHNQQTPPGQALKFRLGYSL
jgi:hypothetical protein